MLEGMGKILKALCTTARSLVYGKYINIILIEIPLLLLLLLL
jgi:hypothetical protein